MSAVWERTHEEGEEAFHAFTVFRDAGVERSIVGTAAALGRHRSLMTQWARRYDWQARARAYDMHLDHTALAIREVGLQQYAGALNEGLQIKLAALDKIVTTEIARLAKEQQDGKGVDTMKLKRLISAMGEADGLARRSAGMPTVYRSETAPNQNSGDDQIFYIGGGEDDE